MKKVIFTSLTVLSLLVFFGSCDDLELLLEEYVPSIVNAENAEITYTSIKVSGNANSDEGSDIFELGVCWSTNPEPSINDNSTTISLDTASNFSLNITNLTANTEYYFKAYASNDTNIVYGEQQIIKTLSLANTSWNFSLSPDENTSVKAIIVFNEDGTASYNEVDTEESLIVYGTWSLDGNTLTYDRDSEDTKDEEYIFTGTISEMSMSGSYTLAGHENKTWKADPKED